MFEAGATVGGLSRTVTRNGFRFDIGGHRFFTKNAEVQALWHDALGQELLQRPRLSRIYYRNNFFSYPLRPMNALVGLGPFTSLHVLSSFAWRQLFPKRPEKSFEDWVSNRFGHKLYSIFFRTYTEKVWGVPCSELSADWAAQRIRNLNMGRAVLDALGLRRGAKVASLIETFEYPRLGPGQMYEAFAAQAQKSGAHVLTQTRVVALRHDGTRITALELQRDSGARETCEVEGVVSTMPLSELVLALQPVAPQAVVEAARGLRYRSMLTVNMILKTDRLPPDCWIYVHAPEVCACRVQFFRNWSPAMAPDPSLNSISLEYFLFEDEPLWKAPDSEWIETGKADAGRLKFLSPETIRDAFVVRSPKAYPLYDESYLARVATIRQYLARFGNLACAGRYGQFRYNNMDHSVLTGLLAARRLCGQAVDPWAVNEDAQYLEEKPAP